MMNWFNTTVVGLIASIITYFLAHRARIKNKLRDAGINVVATVTDRIETNGRYATVYIHYQFLTLEGWRVKGVSESNPRHILKKVDQVPVIYDAEDSSNHSLEGEIKTDRDLFFIALIWFGVLLVLVKIWR